MKIWLRFAALCGCLVGTTSALAVKESKPVLKDRLDFVVIEVNGVAQRVHEGQELIAVAGDVLELKAAILKDPAKEVGSVNLIGYQSQTAARSGEDRGYPIKSDRDLIKRWSIRKDADVFRIKTATGSTLHGEVFIRLIQPKIKFAELLINGRKRVVREGELLRVKQTDQISVKEVRTNVENDKQEVDFQIVPNNEVDLPGVKLYELRFARAGSVFAKIPMQVEGYEVQPKN